MGALGFHVSVSDLSQKQAHLSQDRIWLLSVGMIRQLHCSQLVANGSVWASGAWSGCMSHRQSLRPWALRHCLGATAWGAALPLFI